MPQLFHSEDGSHTLVSDKFGVMYHSRFGAIEESIHVFISAGLHYQYNQSLKDISIFEMGFGTGLNAYLSLLMANTWKLNLKYTTIEKYPLSIDLIRELNYPNLLNTSQVAQDTFLEMHKCEWNHTVSINDAFMFTKFNEDIMQHQFAPNQYDIIYFDAFAPSSQSILWETPLHTKLYDALKPGGILVTYCAKGVFKRMLKSIGYRLDQLPGPARKHEMTRAIK